MTVATGNAIDRFPGPKAPSIVQLLSWGLRQHEYWNDLSAKYGPVFRVRWPFFYEGRVVCFTTPEAARQVLQLPPEIAHAGEAYKLLELNSGPHSVIVLDEDEHLRMRKLVLSPLHGERLKRWESFAEQRTLEDIATWPVGEVFALRPVVERITMSVILKIVFGVRDPRRSDEMFRLAPMLFDVSVPVGLASFTKYAKLDLGPRSPWGAYRRKRDRFDELIFSEISERRAELTNTPSDEKAEARGDLLSMLLGARDEQGRPMSDVELRDQLFTMLLAGHETTATSLAWAMERLVRNPTVLRELVKRLDEGDTTYLDAVIKETMRNRPVVAQIGRVVTEETEIDDWTVPARTMVIVPMSVLHQDPEAYPEPEAFRPERFLDGEDPGGYSWLPFGGGVRRCPGASLALLEMRTLLTTILREVELVADRAEPERPKVRGITIVPDRGCRVRVVQRR